MVAALAIAARASGAQSPDSACTYARCALNIVPRLSGLTVVRGEREARLATLAFLWPSSVTATFALDSSAFAHARSATRRRMVAALLTDVGAAIVVASGTHSPGAHRSTIVAGAALIAASMPVHFAADAELSRAVWDYNRAFNR